MRTKEKIIEQLDGYVEELEGARGGRGPREVDLQAVIAYTLQSFLEVFIDIRDELHKFNEDTIEEIKKLGEPDGT